MKLCELRDFPSLKVNKNELLTDNQQFSQYNGPLTGIEVEVENLDDTEFKLTHSWSVASDGSLRNAGREFISSPSTPHQVEAAINHLYAELPAKVHFSPRTSVHVHLNCRELTLKQIYNIVILYQCFEDLLYDFAGSERKKSIFCVPIGNTQYYNGFKGLMHSGDLYKFWSKYTGLNVKPLNEYGTIEFRHLRGTKDRNVVFTWLHLLYRLYRYATTLESEELETRIKAISQNGNYSNFGNMVFGEYFTLLQSLSFEKKMQEDFAISKLFINNSTKSIMDGRI